MTSGFLVRQTPMRSLAEPTADTWKIRSASFPNVKLRPIIAAAIAGWRMHGARLIRSFAVLWTVDLLLLAGDVAALPVPPQASSVQTIPAKNSNSIRICLRLSDQSPFGGTANVHVMPSEGYEITGTMPSEGEVLFTDVPPGSYTVEAAAPGFLAVREKIQVEPDHYLVTRFIIMKPRPLSAHIPENAVDATPAAPTASLEPASWVPPGIDAAIPATDPNVECPVPDILHGTGLRMKQFVGNLEKFTATESVEHFVVDSLGKRQAPTTRDFEYVVMVARDSGGGFALDEFRNGSVDPAQFPARIATQGLPGLALLFHPFLSSDFKFTCEGFGQWAGKPAWQVHFVQRPDRPGRILGYRAAEKYSTLALKGRAWIDPSTYQVLRLETQLIEPLRDMGLTEEHIAVSYQPVRFRSQDQQLWLPETADLYVERQGRRYYRRHTFSHFQLFTVDTTQSIQLAKESYGFTNESDRDITGVLTVIPISGARFDPVSVTFTIPAGGSVVKLVGLGKDVGIPVESVASATFAHNGPLDSVKVDAHLSKESTLDVISGTTAPPKP
jgi:hypothetical protein